MIAENRSWKYSILLHFALFLVAAFGLPALLPELDEPQPMVMSVELLPIRDISNVRPSDLPIQKERNAKTKTPVKPEPPKPQPKAPKPVEKTDEPVDEKPFDPNDEAEPVEKKKPKPVEEKKAEKSEEQDFEDVLKDLTKQADKNAKDAKDDTTVKENKTTSTAPFDETIPLGMSEQDALNSAFIPCWSAPAGVKDAQNLIVKVLAHYNPDGTLISSELDPEQKGKYNSDPIFRAAADAAVRATRMPTCNPLRNLPNTLYPKLKNTRITFDPRLMG